MSITTITSKWEPAKKTIEALKKRGITYEQLKPVLVQFRKEKNNKQVKDASTVFYNLFDKVYGHAMPAPDRSEDKAQAEARKEAFNNKSKDSKERIINIKDNVQYQVGEKQLRANLTMIANRFGWTSEQCDKWLKRELEKDSKRKARDD